MKSFVLLAVLAAVLASDPVRAMDTSDYYNVVVAAQRDNAKDVRTFLAQNVSPNLTDPSGRTALSYAAASNNSEIAQMLLSARANPDLRDKNGNTPLYYAAVGGHLELLRMLINAHAIVDAQNREGVTPLMAAADAGWPTIVRALLAAGADPSKRDFTGRDALSWAAGRPAVAAILKDAPRR